MRARQADPEDYVRSGDAEMAPDADSVRACGLAPGRVAKSAMQVAHAASLPQTWDKELLEAQRASDLPHTRNAVGRGTVDVFNFYQGAALINGLSYTPRPVFQNEGETARRAHTRTPMYLNSMAHCTTGRSWKSRNVGSNVFAVATQTKTPLSCRDF